MSIRNTLITLLLATAPAGAFAACLYDEVEYPPWSTVPVLVESQYQASLDHAQETGLSDPAAYARQLPGNYLLLRCSPVPDMASLAGGSVADPPADNEWHWHFDSLSQTTFKSPPADR